MTNKGKILLVGFGPGAKQHMSYRARQAIEEADVVIGYSTYIKLVADLLDGKEVIRKGMTEEIDRCEEAYEQAQLGKVVALISSGDIGVYGMAGPTYEHLLQSGWTPDSDITVEVVPGSTALSACASLVGAPLTHDFCSISLSDLLTPWPTIARRIDAAGRADFVIALYNPKSGRRTGQIVEAQRILLQHRKADTPVALVKSAYRDKQEIQFTTLDKMAESKIGMLTTVLIGNSTTYVQEGLMITPRGYANKYDIVSGEVKAGEQAGRSLSMGLEGWKACVRQYVEDHRRQSLDDAARHFNLPIDDILAAVGHDADLIEPITPHFNDDDRKTLHRIIDNRRDMRHFIPGSQMDDEVLTRILHSAHQSPSVGLMQPWRFIRITNSALREQIAALVAKERDATAEALGERSADFLQLKVEGIRECAELVIAALAPDDGTIFGRRTMPEEMAICSVAAAIQNMWLAARVENIGMGWVSMFDPTALAKLLKMPEGGKPLAILCIGPVERFYSAPMLELEGWRQGRLLSEMLFQNYWDDSTR